MISASFAAWGMGAYVRETARTRTRSVARGVMVAPHASAGGDAFEISSSASNIHAPPPHLRAGLRRNRPISRHFTVRARMARWHAGSSPVTNPSHPMSLTLLFILLAATVALLL